MNKKTLISLVIIGAIAAIAVSGTVAYFNDTETSAGNSFTAGAIDLKIDNHSYYNGVYDPERSWEYDDLDGYLFFDFNDMKPGDWGEDTISIHINDNDAWACMDFNIYNANDNGLTEPEEDDGDTTPGAGRGELQDQIHFVWWKDDGDNVLECDEEVFQEMISLSGLNGFSVPLADSSGTGALGSDPLIGSNDYYIGKAWCYGEFVLESVPQDDYGYLPDNGPDVRNAGVSCDCGSVNNITQSDSVQVALSFRAVQSRNNNGFICESPCSRVSFVDPFENVDNTAGWSTTDGNVVNVGQSFTIFNGLATVYGYENSNPYNMTQRGTRGLGVAGDEYDEIDAPEKIEIVFNNPVFINEFEVRSLFDETTGTEEGDIELYNGGGLVQSYHLTATQAGGSGVLHTIGTDQAVDKIVFYVKAGQTYTSFSEFAVSKLRICPTD